MTRAAITSLALAMMLLCAAPAHSHHSNVAYEVTKVITVTGVVKEFQWVNPHTWLYLTVDDGKGGKMEWAAEGRAPGVLLRAGWTRGSLKPGEKVTVDLSPAKDGSPVGIIARVTKADAAIRLGHARNDPHGRSILRRTQIDSDLLAGFQRTPGPTGTQQHAGGAPFGRPFHLAALPVVDRQ